MSNYAASDTPNKLAEQNRRAADELRDALAKRFPAYAWEVKPCGSTRFYVRAKDILTTVFPAHKGLYWAKVENVRHRFSSVRCASFEDAVLRARGDARVEVRTLAAWLEG